MQAGQDLSVFDLVEHRMAEAREHGGTPGTSPLEVAKRSSLLFLMVLDQGDIEDVLFGKQGAAAGLKAGDIVIIMSTVPPACVQGAARRLETRGVEVLDAPVSGGRDGAIAGTLTIMVGGDNNAFNRTLPFLEIMGAMVTRVGSVGSGQIAKAANQIIVGLTRAAIGEALRFASSAGADPEQVRQALAGGYADSVLLATYGARRAAAQDPVEFSSKVIAKDMKNLTSTAGELGLELPFTELLNAKYSDYGVNQ